MAILGKDTLPLKRQRFVEALLGEAQGNATEAARIAGYKGDRNALHVTGHRLLRDATVRDTLAKARDEVAELTKRSTIADRIEQEEILTDIARGLLMETRPIRHGEDVMFEECVPMHADRLKALDQLARRHGLIVTKVDAKSTHQNPDGSPVAPISIVVKSVDELRQLATPANPAAGGDEEE